MCKTAMQTWLDGVTDQRVKKKTCADCQQGKNMPGAANSSYKKNTTSIHK
jgi:hypothetical protein